MGEKKTTYLYYVFIGSICCAEGVFVTNICTVLWGIYTEILYDSLVSFVESMLLGEIADFVWS